MLIVKKILLPLILSSALLFSCFPINTSAYEYTESSYNADYAESSELTKADIIKELTEKREANVKYFAMSDGTTKACIYPQNVHYLEKGKYKQIDNTLIEENVNGKKAYINKSNNFKATIPEYLTDDYIMFSDENGFVKFKLKGASRKKIKKIKTKNNDFSDVTVVKDVNSKAVFQNAKTNVDIEYDISGNFLKETIVLNKKTKNSFVFEVITSAESAVCYEDGSVGFFESGNELYIMASPYMTDANGICSSSIVTSLEKTENGYELIYTPDYLWLSDKSRAYPIKIDPTLFKQVDRSTVSDTYTVNFQTASDSDIRGGWDVLNIGRRTQTIGSQQIVTRAFIKFSLPSEIQKNDTIVNAKLDLVHYIGGGESINGTQIDVHELTSGFSESGTWWGNQPSYDSKIIDFCNVNTNNYFSGTQISYDRFDITKLANKWHNGSTNYGLMLKFHNDTSSVSSKQEVFYFAKQSVYYGDISKYIEITYRNTTGLEAYWNYSTQELGDSGIGYINNYNGNLVYVHNDISNYSEINGFTISHIYNSCESDSGSGKYGNGWNLNIVQRLKPITLNGNANVKYVYTDGDGTKHYFIETNGKIIDEDGLGLTLETISEGDLTRKITDKDRTVLKFDKWYYLRSITDVNGNTVNFNYTSYGTGVDDRYLSTVTTSSGGKFCLSYNSAHRLVSVTDNAGRITHFTDTAGNLTKITYPDGTFTVFQYNGNKLKSITDTMGRKINYTYYPNNRISNTAILGRDGTAGTSAEYKYELNQTVIKDNKNKTVTYQFDTFGRVTCIYDDEHNIYSQRYTNTYLSGNGVFKNNKVSIESNDVHYVNNLIQNGTFEKGFTDWIQYSDEPNKTQFSLVSEGFLTDHSVKITTTGNSSQCIMSTPVATAERTYTFSAYVKYENVVTAYNRGAMLEAVTSTNRRFYSEALSGTGDSSVNNGYTKLSLTFTLLPNETINRVTAGIFLAAGTVWIDSAQLEIGETANNINLIDNSGFEYNDDWGSTPHNWTHGFVDYKSGSTKTAVHDGEWAFKIIGDPNNYRNIRRTLPQSGKKGDVYSYGAWAKGDSVYTKTGESNFRLAIMFKYTDNTEGWTNISFNNYVSDWQFAMKNLVAQKDYKEICLYLCYDKNSNEAIFDSVFFFRDTAQSYTYDDNGNVISCTDLAKTQSEFQYNNNKLSKIFNPSGSNYAYTLIVATGQPLYALSSDGTLSEFAYDSAGNPTSAITWAFNPVKELKNGHTYTVVNAKTRNSLDCATSQIGSEVHNWQFYKNFAYQKWQLEETGDGCITLNIYPAENSVKYRLEVTGNNNAENIQLITNTPGSSNAQKFKAQRNSDGSYTLLTKTSNFTKCVDGQPGSVNDNSNGVKIKQYTYASGDMGQRWYFYEMNVNENNTEYIRSKATYTTDKNYPQSVTDAGGNVTTYNYNTGTGMLNSTTDSLNRTTEYTYNANNGRLETVSTGGMTVGYTYENGLLERINANNSAQYKFGYDAFGYNTSVKVGNGNSWNTLSERIYNTDGLLTRQNYGNGQFINYLYDPLDRLTEKCYNGNSRVSYLYDANGRLAKAVDYIADRHTKFMYDLSGRLLSEKVYNGTSGEIDALHAAVDYTYSNKTGHLTDAHYWSRLGKQNASYLYGNIGNGENPDAVYGVSYNGSSHIAYSYDGLGRLSGRTLSAINKTQSYSYAPGGYGENSTTTLVNRVTVDGNTYDYSYDAVGNITEIKKNGETVESYTYDSLNQLKTVTRNGVTTEYSYLNGNITEVKQNGVTVKSYTYGDSSWADLLTSFNGQAITYDPIGNPLTYRGKTITWQNGRQLAGITDANNTIAYAYDADGNRISKTVNGVKTEYIIIDGTLAGEITGENKLAFLYDESGTKYGFVYNGATYFYNLNLQGDVVGIYDSTGAEVVTYTYDEWGRLLSMAGSLADTIGQINPIRYRGYYYDTETGFYHLQSRYYDPETGRFLNADGILGANEDILSYNLFAYCSNNPVNYYDPIGNFSIRAIFNKICNSVKSFIKSFVSEYSVATESNYVPNIMAYSEHNKKGTTNPSNKNKHQKGQARKQKDNHGEKGDSRRTDRSNKRHNSITSNPDITNFYIDETTFSEKLKSGAVVFGTMAAIAYLASNDITVVGIVDDSFIVPLLPIVWDNVQKIIN